MKRFPYYSRHPEQGASAKLFSKIRILLSRSTVVQMCFIEYMPEENTNKQCSFTKFDCYTHPVDIRFTI